MSEGRWDERGELSIVVHGPLAAENIIQVANHCRHWKTLFPEAELIFSASMTDFLISGLAKLALRPGAHLHDPLVLNAIASLREDCDAIVYHGTGALPLPPIAVGVEGSNNVNLQIAAVRAGLDAASGRHVLRVRSDLLFLTRDFVAQYEAVVDMPRGARTALSRRVMLSWLYTLNPFGQERFAFHASDWFNFGLLADVQDMWQVPAMTWKDAIFYRAFDPPVGENMTERRYYPRLAIEQHLAWHWASRRFPDLRLDHRSERGAVEASIDVIVDNFVLCDLSAAATYFPKYQSEIDHPIKAQACITPADWAHMVALPPADRCAYLSGKASRDGLSDSRSFSVQALTVGASGVKGGSVISNIQPTGVLFFGPYVDLTKGRYRAEIFVRTAQGPGRILFRLTANAGEEVLASREVALAQADAQFPLRIEFEISQERARAIEIVCEIDDVDLIEIAGLAICSV